MSDFLTSLLARSFGTAPVVRPRLTSLFEPVRGDTAALRNAFDRHDKETIAVQEEEVIAQVSANRRSQAPPRTLSRPDDAPATIPARNEIAEFPVALRVPHSLGEPEQILAPERSVEKYETNILLEPPARSNADDRSTAADSGNGEPCLQLSKNSPVPALNAPPVKRALTDDSTPALLIPPRVAPAMIELEKIVRLMEESAVPGATAQPVRDRAETKDEPGQLIPGKLPAELRLANLAFAARPQRRQREETRGFAASAPAAEPAVQVTIGRIEVRASKEHARSSRTAAPSPVMPLDEYLRNRTQRVGQ